MTIATFGHILSRIPSFYGRLNTPAMASATAMTAGSQYIAMLGTFWHKAGGTKTVTGVEFLNGTTMTYNGATIRASIQGQATGSGPPGRADGSILGGGNAYRDFTSGTASTWNTGALTGNADITVGDKIALVIAVQSGTPTSISVAGPSFNGVGSPPLGGIANSPFIVRFDGTSTYTAQLINANCAFLCDDGSYGCLTGGFATSAINFITLTSSTNPDEIALCLPSLPIPFRNIGGGGTIQYTASNSDWNLKLYDDALNVSAPNQLKSLAILGEQGYGGGGLQQSDFSLDTDDFAVGDTIAIAAEATGAGNVHIPYFDLPSTAIRDSIYAGMRQLQRQNASGAFSESNSGLRIPLMFFSVVGLDDGAGGGGSSTHGFGFVG